MRRYVDYLLIGGGLGSVSAAEAIRDAGATGSILILSDEDVVPDNRPPLSKQLLRGAHARNKLFLLDERQCREKGIEVLLSSPVVAIDPHKHVVVTAHTAEIQFGQALIATGASAVRARAPGANLPGIYHMRTLADAESIRSAAELGKHAVVLGAASSASRSRQHSPKWASPLPCSTRKPSFSAHSRRRRFRIRSCVTFVSTES